MNAGNHHEEASRHQVERELIRKCRAGDSRFYEPIVRAYEPVGLRIALGMMGDHEDARDALQEAFVKVYDNLASFDLKRPSDRGSSRSFATSAVTS